MANVAITSLPFVTTVVPGSDVAPLVSGGITTKATPNDIVNAVLPSPTGIGTVTPAAGNFTQLSANSTVSGSGFTSYFASPPALGGTAPNTIKGTTITGTAFVGGSFSGTTITGTAFVGGSFAGTTISGTTIDGTTITASTQFSGPGTGLTGLAGSLNIGGNAGTVTNGVYTTGSYSDPAWIIALAGSKISGVVANATNASTAAACSGNAATVTNGVYTTGSYADPAWITSLAGSKISGNISGNAANITAYTINQNVGTTNAPTFAGLTVNNTATINLADTVYGVTSTIAASYGTVTIDTVGGAQKINLIAPVNGVYISGLLLTSGNITTQSDFYAPSMTASAAGTAISWNAGGLIHRNTSSLRYKTNVQDAPYGLADALKLRPVTFEDKKMSEDGDHTRFGGFIAEEVDEAGLTEFVVYNADKEPEALQYGNMVSLAIKAIQELNAKVEALEAQLNGTK